MNCIFIVSLLWILIFILINRLYIALYCINKYLASCTTLACDLLVIEEKTCQKYYTFGRKSITDPFEKKSHKSTQYMAYYKIVLKIAPVVEYKLANISLHRKMEVKDENFISWVYFSL